VGEKSVTQKVGRLTRKFNNKEKGVLVDFNHLDGFFYQDQKTGKMIRKKHLLEIHSEKRKQLYRKLGFKIIEHGNYTEN